MLAKLANHLEELLEAAEETEQPHVKTSAPIEHVRHGNSSRGGVDARADRGGLVVGCHVEPRRRLHLHLARMSELLCSASRRN